MFKQVKYYAVENTRKKSLMKAYRRIAKSCECMGQFGKAISNAKRALELAFYLNDIKAELKVYDFLGKQYYNLNDMDKACYFHNRMMGNIKEEN